MQETNEKVLVPTVLWGQRKPMVLLRVQIQPLEKPDFIIHETHMSFKVLGVGQSGKAHYGLNMVFYEPVNTERCRLKVSEKEVEIRLLKKEAGQWPRLLSTTERPHWLRVDFDHWEDEDGSEEEDEEEKEKKLARERMIESRAKLESTIKQHMEKYENVMSYLEMAKTGYLLIYNGVQWSGFILVVMTLLMKCLREGIDTAYATTAPMLMFCQTVALLEVLHAAFGLVKSGIMAPLMQVLGRFFILFVVLRSAEEIQQHPVVFVLFLTWSLVELFRYPYYALAVMGHEVDTLTWLRYTVWIPLYPVGFTCEATTVWLSIAHFERTGDYNYPLPNPLNMSFHMPTILRIVLILIPVFAYTLISYMVAQRKKKLGGRRLKSA